MSSLNGLGDTPRPETGRMREEDEFGPPTRDMQIAMRPADPRSTGLYDMAKNNKGRHASTASPPSSPA